MGAIDTLLNVSTENDNLVKTVTDCLPNKDLASFVAKYITNSLLAHDVESSKKHRPSAAQYLEVFTMVADSKLSSTNAKALLDKIAENDVASEIAEENGLIQMSDSGEMEKIVTQVITENPRPVQDVMNGEMKAIGFLVGQIMKASGGKANPAEVQKILRDKLGV